MKYFLSSVAARITRLARTDTYDETDARLSTLLIKGSVGTFALKVISTGLAFIISLLLARLLGAKGYGIYAYAMAWASLLAVPSALGLDRLLVREVAVYQTQAAWGLMRGLLSRANQTVLVVSLGLALVAALIVWNLVGSSNSQMLFSFWIALIILPLVTLNSIRQATLRGLNRVIIGQLPEMFIQPMIFVSLIIASYFVFEKFTEKSLTAPWAVGMNVMATGVALIIGTILLHRNLPQTVKEASPAYKSSIWTRSALHMMIITCLQVINMRADIVMLGAMKKAEAVGTYAVAAKGAELITFILFAVNIVLAPTIASLYATGDIKRLQRVITHSARIILLFSLPIGIALIIFGHWFLLLFGREFTQGETALIILSIAQLFSASMGSVGLPLVMTGYEHITAMIAGSGAMLNIFLNIILIPQWGAEGAAIATSSSIIIRNILSAIWVYKRLGIHSTALGRISLRRN